jgi:hypothetical protein
VSNAAAGNRAWRVTVKLLREYSATIEVRAETQEEADEAALAAFQCSDDDHDAGYYQYEPLGLPPPWNEHDFVDYDPEIDCRFRCVDCEKDTSNSGEYYAVDDKVWAASGLAPNDGMLCLTCLEQRIGRELNVEDFTAMVPSLEAWERHFAERAGHAANGNQLSLFEIGGAP